MQDPYYTSTTSGSESERKKREISRECVCVCVREREKAQKIVRTFVVRTRFDEISCPRRHESVAHIVGTLHFAVGRGSRSSSSSNNRDVIIHKKTNCVVLSFPFVLFLRNTVDQRESERLISGNHNRASDKQQQSPLNRVCPVRSLQKKNPIAAPPASGNVPQIVHTRTH